MVIVFAVHSLKLLCDIVIAVVVCRIVYCSLVSKITVVFGSVLLWVLFH